jgi:hypothetical protein
VKAWKKRSDRIRFIYASDRTLSRLGGFAVHRDAGPARRLIGNAQFNVPFQRTAHRGSYDRIPVAAKHDKGLFLPDGVTEVEPDSCLWRKREP